MPGKLYVHDNSDEVDRDQADTRFGAGTVDEISVGSEEELHAELGRRLAAGKTYDRMLVQTHGYPGILALGKGFITYPGLDTNFANKGYYKLFPAYTRIYFDGCNVAAGESGPKFLESAGKAFLRLAGGEVFGHNSYGYAMPWWVPFISGHTVHFSGDLVKLYFGPGAVPMAPPQVDYGRERVERGFKV